MALSDEDYGILYNYLEDDKEYSINSEVTYIIYGYTCVSEYVSQLTVQEIKDFASFIILSEGRELL